MGETLSPALALGNSMDIDTVLRLLCTQYAEDLTEKQRDAFTSMRGHDLTDKQEDWIYGVAEKLGICTAPSRNEFSRMSEKKRAEHAALVKTKLPWERGEQSRALKPPGKP